jgi:hypothetical protein
MNTTPKRVADLKTGDIVHEHGGTFRVLFDALESDTHRPKFWNRSECIHETLAGPANCAYTHAECLEGEIPGYFRPGARWTFQGAAAVRVAVQN